MKSKTIVAMIIAVALLTFAFLKFSGKKETQPFNLTGEWVLDSTYSISPHPDSLLLLHATIFGDPKNKPSLQFNTDSTFRGPSTKDSAVEKYYVRDTALYINEGKGYLPYPIKTMTDTLFKFIDKDTVVFVMKKKK